MLPGVIYLGPMSILPLMLWGMGPPSQQGAALESPQIMFRRLVEFCPPGERSCVCNAALLREGGMAFQRERERDGESRSL